MSDPNVNDAVEPHGEGAESAEDALAAAEGADVEDTRASAEAEAAGTTADETAEADGTAEAGEAAEEAGEEPEDDGPSVADKVKRDVSANKKKRERRKQA